eukprot:SAG22_NODE_1_length_62449_cov_158.689270_34_plen_324_part_00
MYSAEAAGDADALLRQAEAEMYESLEPGATSGGTLPAKLQRCAAMTAEDRAIAAASEAVDAEALGQEDRAMPVGTRIHVEGRGEGVVRGFKRKAVGANEHLIEFGRQLAEPVKLKETARCWRIIADYDTGSTDQGDAEQTLPAQDTADASSEPVPAEPAAEEAAGWADTPHPGQTRVDGWLRTRRDKTKLRPADWQERWFVLDKPPATGDSSGSSKWRLRCFKSKDVPAVFHEVDAAAGRPRGFLEAEQVAMLCKQLGKKLSKKELARGMSAMDRSIQPRERRVSLQLFEDWWVLHGKANAPEQQIGAFFPQILPELRVFRAD